MVNSAKIISPLLSLTVFLTGIGQSSLDAQITPLKDNSLLSQVLDTANNEMLVQKSFAAIDLLKQGDYQDVREFLSPELAERLSQEEIASFWQNVTNKSGKITGYNNTEVINTIDSDIVVISTQFAKDKENIVITYNKKGQIIGVNLLGLQTVEEISEVFIQSLIEKNYNAARLNLHPFLKTELFSPQIQDKWETVIAEYGEAQKIENITVVPGFGGGSGELVTVTVQFDQKSDDILIIFDDNQLITGVNMAVDN